MNVRIRSSFVLEESPTTSAMLYATPNHMRIIADGSEQACPKGGWIAVMNAQQASNRLTTLRPSQGLVHPAPPPPGSVGSSTERPLVFGTAESGECAFDEDVLIPQEFPIEAVRSAVDCVLDVIVEPGHDRVIAVLLSQLQHLFGFLQNCARRL